jgi:hypothetical protein
VLVEEALDQVEGDGDRAQHEPRHQAGRTHSLEEHGEQERADLVRVQYRLPRCDESPDWLGLHRREKNPNKASEEDPCLKAGDLMIALESAGFEQFYTLNSMESQHLCRALGQTLIVCPIDPRQSEIVCDKGAEHWPVFGKTIDKAVEANDAGGTPEDSAN